MKPLTHPVDAPRGTGWVLYDGDCPMCTRLTHRFAPLLATRGFTVLPLQTPSIRERFTLNDAEYFAEMRLLYPNGKHFGGADALLELARHYWWAWPIYAIGRIPPIRALLRLGYRQIAKRRHCTKTCRTGGPHHRHHGVTTFFEMP